jgi:hypothetical protein
MPHITATAQDLALSAFVRTRNAAARLTGWAEAHTDHDGDERGSYSTEMVVIVAALVVLAVSIVAIIAKKALDKANSISF